MSGYGDVILVISAYSSSAVGPFIVTWSGLPVVTMDWELVSIRIWSIPSRASLSLSESDGDRFLPVGVGRVDEVCFAGIFHGNDIVFLMLWLGGNTRSLSNGFLPVISCYPFPLELEKHSSVSESYFYSKVELKLSKHGMDERKLCIR